MLYRLRPRRSSDLVGVAYFLDNFNQGGKYSAQIASHQAELRREEKFNDQKSLNISSLQTDYLNLDISSSGSGRHNERAHSVQAK